MSSTYESDDLDERPARSKRVTKVKKVQERSDTPTTSGSDAIDLDEYGDVDRSRKRVKTGRLEWHDSDGEEVGAKAYQKFKGRGVAARKRATASTKRAKAIDAKNYPAPNKKDEGHTGVGRQVKKKSKAKVAKYDDVPSDDDGMEYTLPDYVKDRRNRFNDRNEKLKEAGLLIPPSYDDVYFSDDERIKTLKERPDLETKPPAPYKDIELPYSLGVIPASIAQYLRDYQVKGAAFLHELFVYQKGGILGDDMGLGKTIQVIAFLTAAYGKTADERDRKRMRKMRRADLFYPRTLVICPASLMGNWQDEFNRWGWWYTDTFHGSDNDKVDVLAQARAGMLEIMITTYDTYRRNDSAINTIPWDCVITDECHKIKSRNALITKSLNQINALCRIGLTGTAIQNNYEELWTLLNWASPGTFGPISTWKITISEPLKLGQSHNATVNELARARQTAKKLVHNLLPQFFLRRMKSLIKDELPKKTDRVVFCPLTSDQEDAYMNFLESDYVQLIKRSSETCDCGSKKKRGWCCHATLENGDDWRVWVFPCIMYLQRLSNHLALLIPNSLSDKDKQAKDTELIQTAMPGSWAKLLETRDSIFNYSNPSFCGKWRVLKKLLKFWHESGNNKVLVFSHSVRLLQMLQALFIHTSYSVTYLDGSMSLADRHAAVRDFNTDPTQFVFLISTKAGGVGLNITSANKVVIVDPNWNPSHDLQAQDRAYRIGQTRDVEVFRLVSQGTLEEIVYARQIYKQQMSNIGLSATSERRYFTGVQNRKDQKGEIFGLQNLFAYQNETTVLRDIVHKTNVAESKADLKIAELAHNGEIDDIDSDDHPAHDEDDSDTTSRKDKSNADSQTPAEEDINAPFIEQLAAEITGETKKAKGTRRGGGTTNPSTSFTSTTSTDSNRRHDPIQAILSSVGVVYTHENSEVIGSSRVEAALSRRAEQADTQTRTSRAFMNESQSQARSQGFADYDDDGDEVQYLYKPPEVVGRRQFCSMAKWAGHEGYDGVVEFALIVEGWTQGERREFLEKFYRGRREMLVTGSEYGQRETNGSGEAKRKVKDEYDDGYVYRGKKEVKKEAEGVKEEKDVKLKLEKRESIKKDIKGEHEDNKMIMYVSNGQGGATQADAVTISDDDDDEL